MRKIEYAKGKNKCKSCLQKFDKGQIAVGQEITKGQTVSTSWLHLNCYQVPFEVTDPSTFQGFNTIKQEDQENVKNYFLKEENHFKEPKVNLSEMENLSEDDKKIVQMAKILSKKFSFEKLKKMLELNQQPAEGSKKMDLAEKIADGIINGALPKCPKCQTLILRKAQDVIFCSSSECGYKHGREYKGEPSLVRTPWKFLENEKEMIEKPKREIEEESKSQKKQKTEEPKVVESIPASK